MIVEGRCISYKSNKGISEMRLSSRVDLFTLGHAGMLG